MFLFIGFVLAIVSITSAGSQSQSSEISSSLLCPEVSSDLTVTNTTLLSGTWYEYQNYLIDETKARQCSIGLYTLMGHTTFQFVLSHHLLYYGTTETLIGNATLIAPGLLYVHLTSQPSDPSTIYSIIGSDYDNYMVLYACTQGLPEIMVYTRTTEPSDSVLNLMYTTIAMNGLPVYDLQLTNQQRCKYPDLTQSVPVSVEPVAPPTVVS